MTSGEEWGNVDFTPLGEYYPASWLDVEAEATVGRTHQRDGLDSLELTPRIGARLHLFKQAVQGRKHERLPLTRIGLSTLVRLEWRNFFYSDDTPNSHEWRARLRREGKFLYIRDWNRSSPDGEAAEETQAFDLRFKTF